MDAVRTERLVAELASGFATRKLLQEDPSFRLMSARAREWAERTALAAEEAYREREARPESKWREDLKKLQEREALRGDEGRARRRRREVRATQREEREALEERLAGCPTPTPEQEEFFAWVRARAAEEAARAWEVLGEQDPPPATWEQLRAEVIGRSRAWAARSLATSRKFQEDYRKHRELSLRLLEGVGSRLLEDYQQE